MTEGLTELERTIARFEEARDELRDLIREAHEATKTLRTVQRDARSELDRLDETILDRVTDVIETTANEQLTEMRESLTRRHDEAVAGLRTYFDQMASDLWKDRTGADLRDVIKSWREALDPRGAKSVLPSLPPPAPRRRRK